MNMTNYCNPIISLEMNSYFIRTQLWLNYSKWRFTICVLLGIPFIYHFRSFMDLNSDVNVVIMSFQDFLSSQFKTAHCIDQ